MFCFRQSNNLINKVYERALKLIYQDNCNFEVLLEKQHNFSIHQRNLQVLMTEISKIVNGIAPPIMNSPFTFRLNQHNLRDFQELLTEKRNEKRKVLLTTFKLSFGNVEYVLAGYAKNMNNVSDIFKQ